MARLSNLFSTFTKKTTDLSLHSRVFALHNVSTSLSSHSGQRDISLRDVATDSIRQEAKAAINAISANTAISAINAIACLQRPFFIQGA